MQDKEKGRLAGKYLFQACRELLTKLVVVQFCLLIVVAAPIIVGLHYGVGWGLLGTLMSLVIWIAVGKKFWFYSTVRLVWSVVLGMLVFVAIFEALRLYH